MTCLPSARTCRGEGAIYSILSDNSDIRAFVQPFHAATEEWLRRSSTKSMLHNMSDESYRGSHLSMTKRVTTEN